MGSIIGLNDGSVHLVALKSSVVDTANGIWSAVRVGVKNKGLDEGERARGGLTTWPTERGP